MACQGDSLRSVVPGAAQDSGVTRKTSVRRDLRRNPAEQLTLGSVGTRPPSRPDGVSGLVLTMLRFPKCLFFPQLGKKKNQIQLQKGV